MKINYIEIESFKCFREKATLEIGDRVSLLIGKNNVGKTAALDALRFVFEKEPLENRKLPDKAIVSVLLNENLVVRGFPKDSYDTLYSYLDVKNSVYGKYGVQLLEKPFLVRVQRIAGGKMTGDYLKDQETITSFTHKIGNRAEAYQWSSITKGVVGDLSRYEIFKVAAERDIVPETRKSKIKIEEKGSGITDAIDSLLNDMGKNFSLVDNDLLNALNQIMEGESRFDSILIQQTDLTTKHICLSENGRRIELSDMGSGIKTIIFVVFSLLYFTKEYGDSAMFMFEEVENNLHPEIQRRLFDYIYRFSVEHKVRVFITSHSNVAINYFYGKEDCVINHIYKDGNASRIKTVKSSESEREILDDLGVRASDMMQSNGVIWVEGPSDRIYVKKWLELVDPALKENEHYSFLYYGGKLLSHFEAEPQDITKGISILKTNRNSALIMDSDIREEGGDINDTKKRIKGELETANSLVWVTKGKEVENYLSRDDLAKAFGEKAPSEQIAQYELFPVYISATDSSFENHKVEFARKVATHFTIDSLNVLDLRDRIGELAKLIRKWNGMGTAD